MEEIINEIIHTLDNNKHIYCVYHGEKDNEIEFCYKGEEYKITIEKVNLEANK